MNVFIVTSHNIWPKDVEAPHILVVLMTNDGDMIFKRLSSFVTNPQTLAQLTTYWRHHSDLKIQHTGPNARQKQEQRPN